MAAQAVRLFVLHRCAHLEGSRMRTCAALERSGHPQHLLLSMRKGARKERTVHGVEFAWVRGDVLSGWMTCVCTRNTSWLSTPGRSEG